VQDDRKPWWVDDPQLTEILRRSFDEFERDFGLEKGTGLASDTGSREKRGERYFSSDDDRPSSRRATTSC
jgi:hypothetical protein